ncbi:MAG: archease [Thermoguttaceae bacterium]
MSYEIFEHTADVGIRVRAAALADLLADAARGLFSLIVANLDAVQPVQEVEFRIAGQKPDDLLFDWLAELLYTFETRRLLFSDFRVAADASGLTAAARGEPIDRRRHEMDMEVKAITYHGLKVQRDGDGWLAEVIVDI